MISLNNQFLSHSQSARKPLDPRMKIHAHLSCLLGLTLLAAGSGALRAQVTNVTCGAVSTNVGAKLAFVNGTNFASTSGYAQSLIYSRVANRYGTNILYSTTNLVFQSLSKSNSTSAAATGSYLVCEVVSVTGPAGGVFSFWEQGAGWPTYEFPVGGTYATNKNRFILSNVESGAGRPDGDPAGNIRGRRFAVTKPGDYQVTFKLYDVSQNHPTLAAPIQAPSDPLTVKFTTGLDIGFTQISKTNDLITVVYKQGALTNLFLESTTNLAAPVWTTVAGPYTSIPNLTTNVFTNSASSPVVFYRLRGTQP